mmetsp:Transcript_3585/g.11132  ORF Transcript_3585/g.11132 Transcript_3585/m.11132 type:complete len:502 (-) Transcript_3585:1427-2932(-)
MAATTQCGLTSCMRTRTSWCAGASARDAFARTCNVSDMHARQSQPTPRPSAQMLHSAGHAPKEWRNTKQWNEPTSAEIPSGGEVVYGLRMVLSPSLEEVEATLLRAGLPVAVVLPSPILHSDCTNASLLLRVPSRLTSDGSLRALAASVGTFTDPPLGMAVTPVGARLVAATHSDTPAVAPSVVHLRFALHPKAPTSDGRVRLSVTLPAELLAQSATRQLRMGVHLHVAAPATDLVRALGEHGAGRAWLPVGTEDPWHRDGAFFGWDARHGGARVTQERRVYMGGLSDEAGASAGVAMAVKQVGMGVADEVAKLEAYVAETLFQGDHPDRNRFVQGADDQVRLSLLYWDDELNDPESEKGKAATAVAPELSRVCRGCWITGNPRVQTRCSWMDCWSGPHSLESWRAYNYPHVTTVYWALYRAARYATPPLAMRRPWEWYLRRAHATALAVWRWGGDPWTKRQGNGVGTAQWGLMVGSVFEILLTDLEREGWEEEAAELQVL